MPYLFQHQLSDQFQQNSHDLGKRPEGISQREFLEEHGWMAMGTMPSYGSHEFTDLEVSVYRNRDPTRELGNFLVIVTLFNEPLMEVFCWSPMDLLALFRDWICPLMAFSTQDLMAWRVIDQLTEIANHLTVIAAH